jgi:flagellar hook-length control protein FliK
MSVSLASPSPVSPPTASAQVRSGQRSERTNDVLDSGEFSASLESSTSSPDGAPGAPVRSARGAASAAASPGKAADGAATAALEAAATASSARPGTALGLAALKTAQTDLPEVEVPASRMQAGAGAAVPVQPGLKALDVFSAAATLPEMPAAAATVSNALPSGPMVRVDTAPALAALVSQTVAGQASTGDVASKDTAEDTADASPAKGVDADLSAAMLMFGLLPPAPVKAAPEPQAAPAKAGTVVVEAPAMRGAAAFGAPVQALGPAMPEAPASTGNPEAGPTAATAPTLPAMASSVPTTEPMSIPPKPTVAPAGTATNPAAAPASPAAAVAAPTVIPGQLPTPAAAANNSGMAASNAATEATPTSPAETGAQPLAAASAGTQAAASEPLAEALSQLQAAFAPSGRGPARKDEAGTQQISGTTTARKAAAAATTTGTGATPLAAAPAADADAAASPQAHATAPATPVLPAVGQVQGDSPRSERRDADSAPVATVAAGPAAAPLVSVPAADGAIGSNSAVHTPTASQNLHPAPVVQNVPLAQVPIEIGMKALSGTNQFQIRLAPNDLGAVDVKLQIDEDGRVRAHLTVDRPETLAFLQRDSSQLQQAFEQAGLKTQDGGISMTLRDPSSDSGTGQNRNQAGDEQRGRPGQPDRAPDDGRGAELLSAAQTRQLLWPRNRGVDLHI